MTNKKKTILIATDNFLPRIDGISRFLEMFIPALNKYNVIVVAPDFPGSFQKENSNNMYTVRRIKLRKLRIGDYTISKNPKKIKSLIENADLVFANTIGPIGSTIIKEASLKEKPIISYIHSIEWVLMEKSLSKLNLTRSILSLLVKFHAYRIYSLCTELIVPSTDVGEIYSLLGIKSSKYVIPLGIDSNKFSASNKEKAKQDLEIDKDDYVIGYVGRIAREKDLFTLKKAFNKIEGKKKLLIVGDGIKAIKKKLEGENIIITGKKEDIIPYLNAMDVFVMPSLTETTCLAVLEAMSCEIPVITTKVGSMRDYIKNKENGLFFPKSNETLLSLRINYLKNNNLKSKNIAKNARKTVLKEFSWEITKKKLLKVFGEHLK
ncbi:MAG: glycosyltransferase family 4 protein [Candidatus Woesearchaeota archaeon]